MTRRGFTSVVLIVLAVVGVGVMPSDAQDGSLFHSVPSCVLFDTRVAGGALAAGEIRTFHVVGSTSDFAAQGGTAGGCGIPGFFTGQPVATAAFLNLIAAKPEGTGSLRAWPSDAPQPPGELISYQKLTPQLNIANASVVAVRQDVEGADITIRATSSGTHVKGLALGYFTEIPAETDPLSIRKGENNPLGAISGQITSGRQRIASPAAGPVAIIFTPGIANVNAEKDGADNCTLTVLNSPFSGRTYTFTRQVFPTGGAASFTAGTVAQGGTNSINLGAGGNVRWQLWEPGAPSATARVITIDAFAVRGSTLCDYGATMYTGGS